jgi:hypothetical protein
MLTIDAEIHEAVMALRDGAVASDFYRGPAGPVDRCRASIFIPGSQDNPVAYNGARLRIRRKAIRIQGEFQGL